jgi:hypothetical protein
MRVLIVGLQGVEPTLLLENDRLSHVQELLKHGISGVIHSDPGLDPVEVWPTLVAGRSLNASVVGRGGFPPRPLIWDAIGTEAEPVKPILVNLPFDHSHSPETGIGNTINRSISSGSLDRGDAPESSLEPTRERFRLLREFIAKRPWTVAMLREMVHLSRQTGDSAEEHSTAFDEELGRTLEQVIAQESDLCVLLLAWHGTPSENPLAGTGADVGSDPAGSFVLTSSKGFPSGVIDGARLIDLAPTIIALAGRAIPPEMQGRPLQLERINLDLSEEELAVRDRLQGLGYLA